MNCCACCGTRLVRQWFLLNCGACLRDAGVWTEAVYEEELQLCRGRMDHRLRSLPFFVPLVPKRPTLEEELS